jgi:hypothetical protein
MGTPYHQVSHEASLALTDFNSAFDAAYAIAEEEDLASRFGAVHNMAGKLETIFPIPIDSPEFRKFEGDHKFRRLGNLSMRVRLQEWQDGVEEHRNVIRDTAWNGWGRAPDNMAKAAARFPNKLLATMLAENTYTGPYLDLYTEYLPGGVSASTTPLFYASHLSNPLNAASATFGNIITSGSYTAIDETLIKALKYHFNTIPGPNVDYLPYELTHLFVNPNRWQESEDFFELSTVTRPVKNVAGDQNVGGVVVENRHKGSVQPVKFSDWGSAFDDLVIGFAQAAPAPWVVCTDGPPEQYDWDEQSEFCKNTGGRVKTSRVLKVDVKAALPHAVILVDLGS